MRVSKGTGCVLGGLLGLPEGLAVELVEQEADGSFTVHVVTVSPCGTCCPGCGTASGWVKETVGHTVRHLVVAPVRVTWHKKRLTCGNTACLRGGFVEDVPLAARGGRMSLAGLATAGHLVGDWMVPVSRVAAVLGASWHTVHGGFVSVAETAGIVTGEQVTDPDGQGEAPPAEPVESGCEVEPAARGSGRSVSGPLPPVAVLGLDDQRRGRPRWHRDPATGRSVTDADRWQSVLIDSAGGHGLLGVVEGRSAGPVAAWLLARPALWRAGIGAVTIDMSTTYQAAARVALPDAMIAVDPFHVAQLANRTVGDVRRRATHRL
ncbi:transposase, partial [Parafrankia sp. FMc2]|uniref:transposase n=1 Tax=Parafrankia sp. FMc2 TaxID=3233196 RepID=UPI0034D6BBEB